MRRSFTNLRRIIESHEPLWSATLDDSPWVVCVHLACPVELIGGYDTDALVELTSKQRRESGIDRRGHDERNLAWRPTRYITDHGVVRVGGIGNQPTSALLGTPVSANDSWLSAVEAAAADAWPGSRFGWQACHPHHPLTLRREVGGLLTGPAAAIVLPIAEVWVPTGAEELAP